MKCYCSNARRDRPGGAERNRKLRLRRAPLCSDPLLAPLSLVCQYSKNHRVGVRFPEGRELLPFYTDPGEKPTFTILPPISVVNFYALLPPTAKFSPGALRAPFGSPHTVTSTHPIDAPTPMAHTAAAARGRYVHRHHCRGALITPRPPPRRDRRPPPAPRHHAHPRPLRGWTRQHTRPRRHCAPRCCCRRRRHSRAPGPTSRHCARPPGALREGRSFARPPSRRSSSRPRR